MEKKWEGAYKIHSVLVGEFENNICKDRAEAQVTDVIKTLKGDKYMYVTRVTPEAIYGNYIDKP